MSTLYKTGSLNTPWDSFQNRAGNLTAKITIQRISLIWCRPTNEGGNALDDFRLQTISGGHTKGRAPMSPLPIESSIGIHYPACRRLLDPI